MGKIAAYERALKGEEPDFEPDLDKAAEALAGLTSKELTEETIEALNAMLGLKEIDAAAVLSALEKARNPEEIPPTRSKLRRPMTAAKLRRPFRRKRRRPTSRIRRRPTQPMHPSKAPRRRPGRSRRRDRHPIAGGSGAGHSPAPLRKKGVSSCAVRVSKRVGRRPPTGPPSRAPPFSCAREHARTRISAVTSPQSTQWEAPMHRSEASQIIKARRPRPLSESH